MLCVVSQFMSKTRRQSSAPGTLNRKDVAVEVRKKDREIGGERVRKREIESKMETLSNNCRW